MQVAPQRVSEWLTGKVAPGAERTLQLLEWVAAEEAKTKTLGSARDATKGKRTRSRNHSHEPKTGPP